MLAPKTVSVELLNGKVVRIGAVTLGHVMEIEEKYGSLTGFIEKIQPKGGASDIKLTTIIEALFIAVENKDDFDNDLRTFAKHVPVAQVMDLQHILVKQLTMSLPEKGKPGDAGAGGGKGKAAAGN